MGISNEYKAACIRLGLVLFAALLAIAVGLGGCSGGEKAKPISFGGQTMGTLYSIKIVDRKHTSEEQVAALKDSVDVLLNEINRQMSTWDANSEISAFNRSSDTGWFEVSPDFAGVVDLSLQASRLSDGAFDITVGPLVNLWGFGAENAQQQVPSKKDIEETRKRTGHSRLQVRMSPPALKKSVGTVYCDLAAVAKGFAVDRIASLLDSTGFTDHLVEIGGEVKATGLNARGDLWLVGIETPDSSFGIQKALLVDDRAMATSGDYMNYFEKEGVRYSHLIDPRTGYPISHTLASVTVLDASCLFADALATAISVLGPQEGYDLAVRLNLAALLVVREGDGFVEVVTPELEKLLTASKK